MSQINIRNLCNENEDGAPTIVGVSTFSATSYMCPPKGTTAQRPENPVSGSLRFNTDTASLEYYKGNTIGWTQIEMTSPDLDGGARGVYGPGEAPAGDTMEYITISTLGNATDFGNLTQDRRSGGAGGASRTRGLFAGGQHPSPFTFFNIIDYITIASTGNATDFGDMVNKAYSVSGLSDSTRGLINYGTEGPGFTMVNTIDYITMSSVGTNAQDFGDLSQKRTKPGGLASSTRGLWGGGATPTRTSTIDYNTIATLGDAIDFGDLGQNYNDTAGGSNSIRGIFALGQGTWGNVNVIQYVTIATTGNAVDFGDRSQAGEMQSAVTSPTRYVLGGGSVAPASTNVMEYVQIMTTGNSVDFGDLASERRTYGACSNAHGGL